MATARFKDGLAFQFYSRYFIIPLKMSVANCNSNDKMIVSVCTKSDSSIVSLRISYTLSPCTYFFVSIFFLSLCALLLWNEVKTKIIHICHFPL